MVNRFKYIISSPLLYKEIQFPTEKTVFKVGTAVDADTRLHREDFSEDFWLLATLKEQGWHLECSETVYIDSGDVRKLFAVELRHGNVFKICSVRTGQQIFSLEFLLDFDYGKKEYDSVIDLSTVGGFTIGTAQGCNIVILNNYGSDELLEVFRQEGQLAINVRQTSLGCFYNGVRMTGSFRIGQKDFFALADAAFYYKGNMLYIAGIDRLQIQGLAPIRLNQRAGTLVYPKFNRNTQPDIVLAEESIKILSPSDMPQKPKDSLLKSLMPSVLMLVLIVVVRGFMADGGGSSYVLFSVCSMAIGIVTTIVGFIGGKKEYQQEVEQRKEDYRNYIQEKRKEITEARATELSLLREKYPDISTMYGQVMGFSGNLFDRLPEKEDFSKVRVGEGSAKAKRQIAFSTPEKITPGDDLEQIPEKLQKEFETISPAPVCFDFSYAGNVGIVGPEAACYGLLRTMVFDLAVHRYETECRLFFVFEKKRAKQLSWIRFLPHVQDRESRVRNIVYDEASRVNRFEYLYKELCRRETAGKDAVFSAMIVFVLDDMGLGSHPISRFFENAGEFGVHFIFFRQSREELPLHCGQIVEIADNGNGVIIDAADRENRQAFVLQSPDEYSMEKTALKLAPVYCDEISLESELTKNITLYQMLDIFHAEDLDLASRWGSLDVCRTMAAPLGVKAKGQVIYLDLHEKAHGPHGLVAGTTGSGKSEIMQTYILSLATLFSPYEAAFVLIDFKGGGMANQFLELPHLLGAITDIDGKEINRSLLSIRAELDRRKELFAQAGVNNINHYIRKFKDGEISVPLPHLIIVVDEFAELKAEQPEFMKELISASRIGRSLGVHLILATQKPAGQVSEQIWSNSRFKLCLKVQTQGDSNEVLKSPLAAEIREPGRAYFQVGNNEIFELFQSAYSGAAEQSRDDNSKLKEYSISKVDLAGRRTVVFEQKNQKGGKSKITQLEAIVSHISRYCRENNMEKLPNICLPPLPQSLPYPEEKADMKKTEAVGVDIGIYDAPTSQYQGVVRLNLAGENTMLVGASQYGKSNLLQTMLKGIASCYSPEEAVIYILDFGSMFLKNYEKLPHVGGVVCASDEEKFKNLFKLLNREIALRKDKLIAAGVSSFNAYKEGGNIDLPAIIVMVDNFTAVKETYFGDDDLLLPICRDGLSVGISVVIANDQAGSFGYRYYSVISNKVAFYCNDHDDINSLFGYCRTEPDMVPGRCLVQIDKGIYEAQTYLAFSGEREIDRSVQIREWIEGVKSVYPHSEVKHIPEVPEILSRKAAYEFAESADKKRQIVIGLDYETVESILLTFEEQFMLGVIAKEEAAREQVLDAVMSDIRENAMQRNLEIYFIDSVKKRYKEQADFPYMADYSSNAEQLLKILEDMQELMEERNDEIEEQGLEYLDTCKTELIIVNSRKALDMVSASREHMEIFDRISKEYRKWKIMFLFADVENAAAGYSAPEMLKRIREERKCIVLQSLKDCRLFELPPTLVRKKNVPLRAADAFYIYGDDIFRMKLPTCP